MDLLVLRMALWRLIPFLRPLFDVPMDRTGKKGIFRDMYDLDAT
jgi:hypothetical protein